MLRCVFVSIIICCTFGSVQAIDSLVQAKKQSQKVYIDKNLFKPSSQGIIVAHGKHAFLVKAVRFDQKGLFFLKKDRLTIVENARGRWKCDDCPRVFNTEEELLWHILEKHCGNRPSDDYRPY